MVSCNVLVSITTCQVVMLVAPQGKTRSRQNDQDTKAELPQLGMWRDPSDS